MKQHHPGTLSLAVLLLALIGVWGLANPRLPGHSQIPPPVVIGAVVFGIAGLIAAAGLWAGKQWATRLAVIVSAVNALSAAPGIAFAPNLLLHVSSSVAVICAILIIVLVRMPATRRSLAPASS